MKRVEAVIRQECLSGVLTALNDIGYGQLTTVEANNHGEGLGVTRQWRGMTYVLDVTHKTMLEVLVEDALVQRVVSVIQEHAHTAGVGDGTITVVPVEDVIDVRTGKHACSPRAAV